jgi:hypothetical protein
MRMRVFACLFLCVYMYVPFVFTRLAIGWVGFRCADAAFHEQPREQGLCAFSRQFSGIDLLAGSFTPTACVQTTDAHEKPRREITAQDMMYRFFETGEIVNTCGGPCRNVPL